MRPRALLAASVVVAAVVVAVVVRQGGDAEPPTAGTASLLGDSLNVGIEPYLAGAMPNWHFRDDDRVGRTTPEGITRLRAAQSGLAPYLIVSLGTNDRDGAAAYRSHVEQVLRIAGPDRCVIWATIWRDGKPDDTFNAILRRAAENNKRLRLVDWAGMVAEHEAWLAPDHLHGTEDGYRQRAAAVATAVASCVPGQTLAEQ